jgi:hypothetical protein
MATAVVFHEAMLNIGNGAIDLDTHTFKAVLSLVAPVQATHDELADITQIANGNGYTTGGVTLTSVTFTESGAGTGIWVWTCADFSWTASGGSIADFRYVSIYSDTSTGDKLLLFIDYGGTVTITNGNSFTGDVQATGLVRFTVT